MLNPCELNQITIVVRNFTTHSHRRSLRECAHNAMAPSVLTKVLTKFSFLLVLYITLTTSLVISSVQPLILKIKFKPTEETKKDKVSNLEIKNRAAKNSG